jgi:hypothetical protein
MPVVRIQLREKFAKLRLIHLLCARKIDGPEMRHAQATGAAQIMDKEKRSERPLRRDTAQRKAAIDAATYNAMETLHDGTSILIRAIRPDDKDRLVEHARGPSPESVNHRFMPFKRNLSEDT